MKISKKYLQIIINEEIDKLLSEQAKDNSQANLGNKTAKAFLETEKEIRNKASQAKTPKKKKQSYFFLKLIDIAKKAYTNQTISLRDAFSFMQGIENAVTNDLTQANFAVKNADGLAGMLRSIGVDFQFGILNPNINDKTSTMGASGITYPENLSGGGKDFKPVTGFKIIYTPP